MIPIRDTIPSRRAPIVTWSIIATNVAVFLYELTLDPQQLEALVYRFGVVPARITHPESVQLLGFLAGDYSPFLTSMFLHGGWAHVIGNMWSLWIFGDNVEDVMGRWRYIAFYLLTGVAAGLTHVFTNAGSNVPTVGASGAIAGIFGAYFLLFPRARIIVLLPILFFPFFFELPAVTYLLFWLLTNLFSGTLAGLQAENAGGVAWWAHVGGFGAGVLLHRLFLEPKARRERRRQPDEYGVEDAWARQPRQTTSARRGRTWT
jgi:membrane associated rhomboid family serine protease